MERGFQSLLITGKYEISDDNYHNFSPFTPQTNPHTQYHNIQTLTEYKQNTFKRLKTEPQTTSFCFPFPPTNVSTHLPNLHSVEHNHTLDSLTTSFSSSQINTFIHLPNLQSTKQNNSKTDKMHRLRNKISDKTQSLQRLLPVEKKMDIATIYEEAYKYIVFLKAQITALECMPVLCSSSGSSLRCGNPRYVGLEKLNRQQLLEIVVNSPVAQSVMYSKGCCVYSVEQLMLFNDVVQKRFFFSDH